MDAALHTVDAAIEAGAEGRLDPRSIGAYWLQGKIHEYVKDAVASQKLADQVLAILKESTDERVCESNLVNLLQFDKFELIKLIRNNRNVILYATLLARAQNASERTAIEETMAGDDELAGILAILRKVSNEDNSEEARARKAALRKVRRNNIPIFFGHLTNVFKGKTGC